MLIKDKLWGRETWLVNDKYCGKILELKPYFSSSYHCHKIKQETFYCLEGSFTLFYSDKLFYLTPKDEPVTIQPGEYHSFRAREPAKILEISTKHSEEDVYRKDESHKLLTYCFDLDGVICSREKDYSKAKPDLKMIEKINRLWDTGHRIIFYTARGQTTGIDWTHVTEKQLSIWGVRYDNLIMNKPFADFYVDDKAINVKDFGCKLQ